MELLTLGVVLMKRHESLLKVVDGYECTCAANACATVHDDGVRPCLVGLCLLGA